MDRVIKYRVYNHDTEVMEQVGAMDWDCHYKIVTVNTETTKLYMGADQFTLMAFTGVQDKTGNDIYEGDIIRVDGNKFTYQVVYDRFGVPCYLCDEYPKSFDFTLLGAQGVLTQSMIIGNIYESPELWKGGEYAADKV